MALTWITKITNSATGSVELAEINNGQRRLVASVLAGQTASFTQEIPWALNQSDFGGRHLRLEVSGPPRYWIWQSSERDSDHVRVNTAAQWIPYCEPVDGISKPDGFREMVVYDSGFQLVDFPGTLSIPGVFDLKQWLLAALPMGNFRLSATPSMDLAPSNPRSEAIAFSIAGPPADRGDTVYKDSGKRYRFALINGVVRAHDTAGSTDLTEAVSYDALRRGDRHTAPPFNLIAASGSRVLARATESNDIYFATMDPLFMHGTPSVPLFEVPSAYFKLDPEYNQAGATVADLMPPLEGWFGHHPGAERWPMFRFLLSFDRADMMVVRVEPRVWHKIDARPPLRLQELFALPQNLISKMGGIATTLTQINFTRQAEQFLKEIGPPPQDGLPIQDLAPAREAVQYSDGTSTIAKLGVKYIKVLDIGVGHVHHYEQYLRLTGGELQPMLANGLWLNAYQLFNGPIFDGDGFIDGTSNFYALVQLEAAPAERYGVIFIDEQSYFSQRWRLVDPRDSLDANFSVFAARNHVVFGFDESRFWSPFDSGHIGGSSRMAVAAQVIAVTGAPDAASPDDGIFTINYSWSTMDRTWRRRPLPPGTQPLYIAPEEDPTTVEPGNVTANVYPQTIRLREDMSMVLKGSKQHPGGDFVPGRWIQQYLSLDALSSASPVTPLTPLGAGPGDPPTEFGHPWKFINEDAFALADAYSHLGIYDEVDSRCQFYVVEPHDATDETALLSSPTGEWIDAEFSLYRWAPKFSFSAPTHLVTAPSSVVPGALDRKPPSLHNRRTRLRIVRRGRRWIAVHFDKRDDDLLPFDGTDFGIVSRVRPVDGLDAVVTIHTQTIVNNPPMVLEAQFHWDAIVGNEAAIVLTPPAGQTLDLLHRLRMSALDVGAGQPVHLLDADVIGNLRKFNPATGSVEYRWVPDAAIAGALDSFTTAQGAFDSATSIWVEDIVGRVATPEVPLSFTRQHVPPLVLTLIIDQDVTVRESDGDVDTTFDLHPGDQFEFIASGSIWAGVVATGDNGPAGWNNVDHDEKFPLHVGNDAHPYALIGRFGPNPDPWFYIGDGLTVRAYEQTTIKRLYLRTNDDKPGNGRGSFTCRVRIWRWM